MVTGLAVPTCLLCFEKRVPREVAAGPVGARLADIGCPGSSWVPSQQPGRGLRGAAQCLAGEGGCLLFQTLLPLCSPWLQVKLGAGRKT